MSEEILYTEGEWTIRRSPSFEGEQYQVWWGGSVVASSSWTYTIYPFWRAPQGVVEKWQFLMEMMR